MLVSISIEGSGTEGYVKVVRACVCVEEGTEEKRSRGGGGDVPSVKFEVYPLLKCDCGLESNGHHRAENIFFPLTVGGLPAPPLWK